MPSDHQINEIPTRDLWLQHATNALRPLFDSHDLPLPVEIRFAIAFTSTGRKSKRVGETWHSGASADGSFEIFLRADLAEPMEILAVLVRQLVHAALPAEDSHGKRYKAAANKIGLRGKMREATPGPYLQEWLERLATEMPPLPHAALNIDWKAVDKPRKQGTRMLKAECAKAEGLQPCGYTIRLSAKWAALGAVCPKHGAMALDVPEDVEDEGAEIEAETDEVREMEPV
jgi:hypothetical protein